MRVKLFTDKAMCEAAVALPDRYFRGRKAILASLKPTVLLAIFKLPNLVG